MSKVKFVSRLLLAAAVACGCALTASASSDDNAVASSTADRDAAHRAKSAHHAMLARTDRGNSARSAGVPGLRASAAAPLTPPLNLKTRYPGDLVYNGGNVVDSTQSHPIFLRPNGVCPIATCWGDPETFLRDLGRSDLIHVVDQYVGLHSDNRYTLGSRALVNFTPSSTPLTDNDVLAYVHAVAAKTGQTGYGHIYHVFIPPGTDEYFDSTFSECYSPDNFNTFFFCAYHGYADFDDIGHVLYSVEPYQNVPGCREPLPTPNGTLADSTNDTLSHELIEAITDPDLDAWWNSIGLGMYGQEIADECLFLDGPVEFRVGGRKYVAQLEYSNHEHACVSEP